MNRLAHDTDATCTFPSPPDFVDFYDVSTVERRRTSREGRVPHATFAPMHYEAKYSYPLLVWLHGSRSNEHELRQIMPLVSMRNYVAVAPRGTEGVANRRGRYRWRQSGEGIEFAASRVGRCIALARRRFNINPGRVFLVGHGSGGTMALRVAWNEPQLFAGVVAINGPLPRKLRPMRRVNELRHLPCFLATMRDSRAYPAERVCNDLRLLHAAGCTVALRQYPGGDGLTTKMLSDLDCWLMDLVCGSR